MFKILLDPLLSAYGVSNSNCKVYDSKLNIMIQSPLCYRRDRNIFIKLGTNPYTVGISNNFQLNGVLISPSIGG